MLLTMILDQARNAELKQLSVKDKTDEVVISYLNTALVALYSRYDIKTEEALVSLKTGKTLYKFDSTDPDVTVAGLPMVDGDVLVISAAFGEMGIPLTINDVNDPLSVFTPSYNNLQVPLSIDDAYISIIYRQNPTLLNASLCDETTGELLPENSLYDVELPQQLLEPLLHYIGYRAHGSVHGAMADENNIHYMRYVASCKTVDTTGVMSLSNLSSRDVQSKGFV